MTSPKPARRIVLAATGLSPQVVTESVYALAVKQNPAWVPTEVHVVTTTRGAENVRLQLLSETPGWFHRLRADYALPPIAFSEDQIHVIRRPDGTMLDDIRDDADNAAAADFIADLIRKLTSDPDAEVHASIAGGRKTMGFFVGYAMSLWGRTQDRLSHVLVSAPYESHPEFFYPTPATRVITHHRDALDTRQAQVWLGDIPFVRLRDGLDADVSSGRVGFAEAVARAQQRIGPPTLELQYAARRIVAAGRSIALPPVDLAFIGWFARRSLQGLPGLSCPADGAPSAEHARDYLAEYRRVVGMINEQDRTAMRYRHGMSNRDFDERRSKLKRLLKDALGPAAAEHYAINAVGGPSGKPRLYALNLPAEWVHFI